jgi:sulfotransferase
MKNDQPVGIAYNRIRDALTRGYADRMHFVEFEALTTQPETTMQEIYKFLEEPLFKHNFDHVEQTTSENDDVHGIPGLHTIRNKVEGVPKIAKDVLGVATFDKYTEAQFWRGDNVQK